MFTLPKTVRFGAVEYRVVKSPEALQHPHNPKLMLQGATLPDRKKILIYANPEAPSMTEETFIHEVLEAIVIEYDLGVENPETGVVSKLNHQSIKTLGVALHQVLKESGMLFGEKPESQMIQ